MKNKEPKNIEQFIDDIASFNNDFYSIMLKLRDYFLSRGQKLDEAIKYGGLVFLQNNKLIGGIFVYKKHISIEFSNGVNFKDPSGLLEGRGKFRRHIKISEEKDIEKKQAESFIKQACSLEFQ